MSVLDIARVLIYRVHEKGLEIFLINDEDQENPSWKLPEGSNKKLDKSSYESIPLEPLKKENGESIKAYAVEGEWHDVPSIRALIRHDIDLVKSKLIEVSPEFEKGGFFAVKEAFKKMLPEEYHALKELKSIIRDRNLTKYI